MEWSVRGIRGATTTSENTEAAIRDAVMELLDELEGRNPIDLNRVISVTFSVTRDLDAIFPAAIARSRPGWDSVPLLDVQHMFVPGDLDRCIRVLIHAYLPTRVRVCHPYLHHAKELRPDLAVTGDRLP